jgi:DNA mismatch repair protein MutH
MAEYMQLVRLEPPETTEQLMTDTRAVAVAQLALDTIGELAFGKSFQLCEAGRDIYGFLPDLLSFTFGACLAGERPDHRQTAARLEGLTSSVSA